MVVARFCTFVAAALALTACASSSVLDADKFRDVYVADFQSDDIERCRPSDVALGHAGAREFFRRAKQVDSKTLHDHYEYAPCYVEGTLKYGNRPCDWEIRASATATVRCDGKEWHFACDDCDDLLRGAQGRWYDR